MIVWRGHSCPRDRFRDWSDKSVRPTRVLLKLHDLLPNRLCLCEKQQVIWPACFRIRPRHIETAKGMCADDRARALAVDVEVADVEFTLGDFDLLARAGIDRAGETELGIIGDLKAMFKISRFNHSQHRSENLFLLEF